MVSSRPSSHFNSNLSDDINDPRLVSHRSMKWLINGQIIGYLHSTNLNLPAQTHPAGSGAVRGRVQMTHNEHTALPGLLKSSTWYSYNLLWQSCGSQSVPHSCSLNGEGLGRRPRAAWLDMSSRFTSIAFASAGHSQPLHKTKDM